MNLTNGLLFFLIGATLAFNVAIFKFQKSLDASIATFLDNTSKSSKSFLEVVERTRTFEATGFEADVTDDGRIKIVFLRKVASKEEDDSKKIWPSSVKSSFPPGCLPRSPQKQL